mmetsp:Transcript_8054/g.23765  ORF Transcript_8054/g.23765 Transcript_8054/m.23765 type:complete len:297 (-) Transcript_8054:336-1226(-)
MVVERRCSVPMVTRSDGEAGWASRMVPTIWKATRSPFSLSMISGCDEDIRTSVADPKPLLVSRMPRVAGVEGSTTSGVKGSSPATRRSRKYRTTIWASGRTVMVAGYSRLCVVTPREVKVSVPPTRYSTSSVGAAVLNGIMSQVASPVAPPASVPLPSTAVIPASPGGPIAKRCVLFPSAPFWVIEKLTLMSDSGVSSPLSSSSLTSNAARVSVSSCTIWSRTTEQTPRGRFRSARSTSRVECSCADMTSANPAAATSSTSSRKAATCSASAEKLAKEPLVDPERLPAAYASCEAL